tara:strand:+ start:3630 stop:4406 length:777 start_codon:yes stop_codon:yes gene_type:complete
VITKIAKIKSLKNRSKIVCLTAYSKNIAKVIDQFTNIILVGDSLGSTLYNFNSTRSVTLEMMIKHSISVRQGIQNSLMVVDMPYNTYNNTSQALKNCKKVMKLTKCDAVKIEGGLNKIKIIKNLIKNKIPVMGHLGILPQSLKGKFKSKGKSIKEKNELIRDCKLLEDAGVFSIVLECVERKLAERITNLIKIPTIGIGSSNKCDGQILVLDDILGLTESKMRFVKKFVNLKKLIAYGAKKFKNEVKSKKYPSQKHTY